MPKDPASLMPSLGMILVVYAVFVIFGWYLLYMYDPITMHRLFSRLFGPFID